MEEKGRADGRRENGSHAPPFPRGRRSLRSSAFPHSQVFRTLRAFHGRQVGCAHVRPSLSGSGGQSGHIQTAHPPRRKRKELQQGPELTLR